MTYAEKLKDPRWQKKRLEILEDREWKCQMCCDKSKTLHVHHAYYSRKQMPWEYEDWAYLALCEDCHEIIQDAMEEAHRVLAIHPHLISAIDSASKQFSQESLAAALLVACNSFQEISREAFDSGMMAQQSQDAIRK